MPSIVACFLISFVPPLWERFIARPRLENWDRHYASVAEQELAMAANQRAGWPRWLGAATTA
jgi:alkane 1-monooxygenase